MRSRQRDREAEQSEQQENRGDSRRGSEAHEEGREDDDDDNDDDDDDAGGGRGGGEDTNDTGPVVLCTLIVSDELLHALPRCCWRKRGFVLLPPSLRLTLLCACDCAV